MPPCGEPCAGLAVQGACKEAFFRLRLGAPVKTVRNGRDLNTEPKSHACEILVSPEYSNASFVSRCACGKSQGRYKCALEERQFARWVYQRRRNTACISCPRSCIYRFLGTTQLAEQP